MKPWILLRVMVSVQEDNRERNGFDEMGWKWSCWLREREDAAAWLDGFKGLARKIGGRVLERWKEEGFWGDALSWRARSNLILPTGRHQVR